MLHSVLNKAHATPHNKRTAHHQARRNTAKVVIIAYMLIIATWTKKRRKVAAIYTLYIMYTYTSIINSVLITL